MTVTRTPDAADLRPIPPDDLNREATFMRPETDQTLAHVSIVGGTYTILVTGRQTAGRYALIDMYVPAGGGPPPHRHDFEEMFHVLEGEVEVIFRGVKSMARAGEAVNIPANAPHAFKNIATSPARLLCMVSPAGEEDFFLAIGDLVPARTAPPPVLNEHERAERAAKTKSLALKYRNEMMI